MDVRLYAFDVHCNSFFTLFIVLYVLHFFLSRLLVAHGFVPLLLSNVILMVAVSCYHYLNFLGCDGKKSSELGRRPLSSCIQLGSPSSLHPSGCFKSRCRVVVTSRYKTSWCVTICCEQFGLSAPVYATEPVFGLGLLTMLDYYYSRKYFEKSAVGTSWRIKYNSGL
ncbi:hypothetical protein L1987_77908 [Smallanthus sonchifolius]|uniref:Uncharacterized protein n=1 Tax=Smallanthus sonchifolius TaxID=185202 RepID=A0ACB8ZB76_9ASTR|nr:hypothetical protein L1987_77908 [Smallanthus sonchifolius]